MKVKSESEVAQSFLTLSDPVFAAYQAPPSMGFSRQEYWSGVPLPSLASIPGSGKSLKKGMATHSSIIAWRIPWTVEPSRLQSMGFKQVRHN